MLIDWILSLMVKTFKMWLRNRVSEMGIKYWSRGDLNRKSDLKEKIK